MPRKGTCIDIGSGTDIGPDTETGRCDGTRVSKHETSSFALNIVASFFQAPSESLIALVSLKRKATRTKRSGRAARAQLYYLSKHKWLPCGARIGRGNSSYIRELAASVQEFIPSALTFTAW